MNTWYWHRPNDTTPRGPISEDALRQMASSGALHRDDHVWQEGMPDWVPAHTISWLFAPSSPAGRQPDPRPSPAAVQAASDAPASSELDMAGPKPMYADRLKGVGGWLLFFCVALTILGPLVSFGNMAAGWEEAKPAFDYYPILQSAVFLENAVVAGILIYGIIVGIVVWSGRPSGKKVAERYLLTRLGVFIAGEAVVLMMLIDVPAEVFTAAIGGAVGAIFAEGVFFTIWFLYFKKSKRVAATYQG